MKNNDITKTRGKETKSAAREREELNETDKRRAVNEKNYKKKKKKKTVENYADRQTDHDLLCNKNSLQICYTFDSMKIYDKRDMFTSRNPSWNEATVYLTSCTGMNQMRLEYTSYFK